jgi:excinuclease ABC subunit C
VPGVYLMKDAQGRGALRRQGGQAARPRRSYFVPSADLGPKKQPMLEEVHTSTSSCEGEWEALLTENRLIKDIKPKYNARLVDDKTFPYLVVTQREDYPRVFVTRNPSGVDDKTGEQAPRSRARVFGPFTNAGALREAVQILQRSSSSAPASSTSSRATRRTGASAPACSHSIGQCTAPCNESIGARPTARTSTAS